MLKNMKVGVKLAVGFGALLVLTVLLGVFAVRGFNGVQHAVEIADDANRMVKNMLHCGTERMGMYVYGISPNGADNKTSIDRWREHIASTEELIEEVRHQTRSKEAQKQLDAIGGAMGNYKRAGEAYIAGMYNEMDEVSLSQLNNSFVQTAKTVLEEVEDFRAMEKQIMLDRQGSAKNATFLFIALGIVLSIIVALAITKSITAPIRKLQASADAIALGNVNEDVQINQMDEIGKLADSFRTMQDNLKLKVKISENLAQGITDCNFQIASEQDVLGKSLLRVCEELKTLDEEFSNLVIAAVEGRLEKRGDAGKFKGAYSAIVKGGNEVIETLVGHLNAVPAPAMIIDKAMNIRYINSVGASVGGKTPDQVRGKKCYDHFKTKDCNTPNCACARAMRSNAMEKSETQATPQAGTELEISYVGVPVKDLKGEVIGALEIVSDQTDIKRAQKKADKVAKFQAHEVRKISDVLSNVADGDLTVHYEIEEADEDTRAVRDSFADIATGLQNTCAGLNDILSQVALAVDQVSSGSQEVSDSSQSLSQGATEQASSLEEITSTMTQIGSQTKLNAENAGQANRLADDARNSAEKGNSQMQQMLNAMQDINSSSTEISKIIKVIDEIAFQTNLLALNAAVEAARAGVHGKGFAVVADEVRNLAQRSATAAKETTELIEGSGKRVEAGAKIANETAEALGEIVDGITKVNDLIGDISMASNEQTQGIDQINEALQQVEQVTQGNTSNAEESASAAEELSSQAVHLKQMLSKFKLKSDSRPKMIGRAIPSEPKKRRSDSEWGGAPRKAIGNGKKSGEVRPEEVIALDDADFGSF